MNQIIESILDLVYPPQCLICRNEHSIRWPEVVCPPCKESLILNHPPFCPKCSRPLNPSAPTAVCHDCHNYPIHFDFAWASSLYNEPLRELLHAFKYHEKTVLRHMFSRQMINFISQYSLDIQQFEALIPVPLYPSRMRERGYNQARLLAEILSRYYHIPLEDNILKRIRPTSPQALLSPKERWTNIAGAFRINPAKNIKGRSLLLIDDLLTTGATVCEAAKTLKAAGAQTVGVLTLAITP